VSKIEIAAPYCPLDLSETKTVRLPILASGQYEQTSKNQVETFVTNDTTMIFKSGPPHTGRHAAVIWIFI
jgi:hypothetical protein